MSSAHRSHEDACRCLLPDSCRVTETESLDRLRSDRGYPIDNLPVPRSLWIVRVVCCDPPYGDEKAGITVRPPGKRPTGHSGIK
jgi:hypothetical protein